MDFSNVKPSDKLMLHVEGFASQVVTVVRVFKKHFRVYADCCYYDFFFTGEPKTKTFFPITISKL